jgi:hypothetical protein
LRLDSAGNIDTSFFKSFCDAAGVYCVGEVDTGDVGYACPYQNFMDGILNYPMYVVSRSFFKRPSTPQSAVLSQDSDRCVGTSPSRVPFKLRTVVSMMWWQ